jgi:hypothetical protein
MPAKEQIAKILAGIRSVNIGFSGIYIVKSSELEQAQTGYAINSEGKSLCGKKPSQWKEHWIVIGKDETEGDPIFVDTSKPELPVFTAEHGTGVWEPFMIADSLEGFSVIIKTMLELANGRETPLGLERNPFTEEEIVHFQDVFEENNPKSEDWYWKLILSNDF